MSAMKLPSTFQYDADAIRIAVEVRVEEGLHSLITDQNMNDPAAFRSHVERLVAKSPKKFPTIGRAEEHALQSIASRVVSFANFAP